MAAAAASASRRCLGALALRCRSFVFSSARLPRCQFQLHQCPFVDIRRPHICQPESLRRLYSSSRTPPPRQGGEEDDLKEEEEDEDEDDFEESDSDGVEEGSSDENECVASKRVGCSGKTEAEKVEEAAGIGYEVVGPLDPSERPFKPYEPVFAVVQIGSHQFKVSNGDAVFTERLKYCEVNDKLILNKVLMLGSATQTIIGRPILPDATVHAIVEEHALDAKVIIFKKKRRKNYRRTKGHRQELTKLRITDIQGIEKPMNIAVTT